MNELFAKFPELIQMLLDKVAQQPINESSEREVAKQKLLNQLKNIMGDITNLSKQNGELLTEEQLKKVLEIPQPQVDLISSLVKLNSK